MLGERCNTCAGEVNMRRLLLITAIAMAYCAAPAWGAEARDKLVIVPPPDKIIVCKRVRVTGTHFKKRVCRTKAMMDQDHANAKKFMDDAMRYESAVQMNERLGR